MANTINLIPNKLVIEQVNASPFWRMRFKVDGKWHSRSTKKADADEASIFAREQYTELEVLERHGVGSFIAHTVSDVSKIYYQQLFDALKSGTGKPTYKAYMTVISKYIDPIAGDWDIRSVSNSRLEDYFSDCEAKLGRQQAKGTINTHNIVWRQMFRIALDRRWIKVENIPELTIKNKGRAGNRRPAFTLDEYKQLRRFLRTYHESADRFSSKYRRQLLREYCIFLFATGMRPGKEVLGLKWKHIQNPDGSGPVTITNPEGKTGDRPIVPMNFIKPSLRRLKTLTKRNSPEDYVFATPDGEAAKGMSHLVSRAFTDAGLRFDTLGRPRTAYSFRHAYATLLRIYRDFSFDELAENMGNSVEMIQRHYNQAKTTDRANRYATGRSRRSYADRKIDKVLDYLESLPNEFKELAKEKIESGEVEDELIFARSLQIEIELWDAGAITTADTATSSNLQYVIDAALNRAEEFLHGESVW